MKVIVTCGPSYEPIDQVRRLTNFSTGELGVHLSNQLTSAGFEVFCLKGSGATHPGPGEQCQLSLFDTNDDLLELLKHTSETHEIAAVFHVAALCDYKVKRVEDDQGRSCNSPKIASRSGALTISLEPATKVIAKMRHLFPESILVGWKYELAGTLSEALAKAARQMQENRTDARVLNGQAYGSGFAFCRPTQPKSPAKSPAKSQCRFSSSVSNRVRPAKSSRLSGSNTARHSAKITSTRLSARAGLDERSQTNHKAACSAIRRRMKGRSGCKARPPNPNRINLESASGHQNGHQPD